MENEYMKELIESFSQHIEEANAIGKAATFEKKAKEIRNVVVCGLGGSGIGGSIVNNVTENELKVPFISLKGYSLPAFVDSNSLVICCSYSGNTEETIELFEKAQQKGAEIAIVTSGGQFENLAKQHNLNHILIPGGLPPRAAFGLAFPQLFHCLQKYSLISDQFLADFSEAVELIKANEEAMQAKGNELSTFFKDKLPVIYGESRWEGVLIRFKQQINENSKMLAWHNVFPELNHNELVGWKGGDDHLAVILIRDEDDYYRNQKRFEYSKEVIKKQTPNFEELQTKGKSFIAKCLYLIHLLDWTSYYLAVEKGIDSVEVNVISGLKDMLADLD